MQTHLSLLPLREESLLQNSLCRYLQEWEELDKYAFTVKQCKYVNLLGRKFGSNYFFSQNWSFLHCVSVCKGKCVQCGIYFQHKSVS